MNPIQNQIQLTIDNKSIYSEKGLTILQVAEQNDIYIPTLCAHKNLTPYGGCRMCLVEVEGARGFLTACTTPVEQNMIVRTHTDQIQKERREIMELILSEHTSSCLICEEQQECRNSMSTIRKVGVTTGCRYCPNDDKCELEKVVSWLGIKELNHPVYYRGMQVEKEDPFYDRDYNLCILCGRCIRMCQEVRMANVLAFTQRGRNTVIGPAFGRNHIEAGCEFCGACVSVCPTGALAEKSSKWDGVPDREVVSTCALCGVGCQMRIMIKNDKVMATLPAPDRLINDEQLCVKGRFCVNELVNNFQRSKKPHKKKDGYLLGIKWDEAIDIAVEKLKQCPAEDFGMYISANCTNEDLYIAQKFTRTVMKSNNIDTSSRLFYGTNFNEYINLIQESAALEDIAKSSTILAIGLDLRYGRSVIGVQIRKALANGSRIITINPNEHSLSLSANVWLQKNLDSDLNSLLNTIDNKKASKSKDDKLFVAAEMIKSADKSIILVGSDIFRQNNSVEILNNIKKLAQKINATVLPLPSQNNLCGSLLMGSYPEILPGGFGLKETQQISQMKKSFKLNIPEFHSNWNILSSLEGSHLKLLYLIGETPPFQQQIAEYTIYQNIYPPENSELIDLILPATTFTETDGSFINGERRIQQIRKAAEPPGEALSDWKILCLIAQKMGATGFDFKDVSEIQNEIRSIIEDFQVDNREVIAFRTDSQFHFNIAEIADNEPVKSTPVKMEHYYRGIPLTEKIAGFKTLVSGE